MADKTKAMDAELLAMARINRLVETLPGEARARVLDYLCSRHLGPVSRPARLAGLPDDVAMDMEPAF